MKNKFLGFLLLLSVLLISCSSNDESEIIVKDMLDLNIKSDFNFTTHRDVEVHLNAFYSGVFYIYDLDDNLLKKGLIDIQDGYDGTVSIPNEINDVKLFFSEVENLQASYEIVNNTIDYSFYPVQEEERDGSRDQEEDQIHPILECIEHLGNGMFLAHYGYLSDFDETQYIPIGPMNKLQNTPDQDMGQPEYFDPGRHENEFTVEFPGDGYRDEEIFYIKWKLGGSLGEGFARADSTSPVCPRGVYDDYDNDGVLDDDDDYPFDDTRAFLNFYPGDDSLAWGTLAFEDKWVTMGDYDFNDVIVYYRFETVDDPDDHLFEVFGYFSLKASGAGYKNGFAIELPFPAENVETLTYTDLAGAELDGTDSQILKFFTNALEVMNKPENSEFVNTKLDDPYLTPVDFEFYLKLADAVDENTLTWQLPYNPFIVVDQNPNHEIHLPDMPPTILADPGLFGQGDDDSNPAINRYYKTANNLPWAINIPYPWAYPLERIQITNTYNYFGAWAESSGAVHNDWYENTGDNIIEENIYQTP